MIGVIGATIDVKDQAFGDIEVLVNQIQKLVGWNVNDGVAAGQANLYFADKRTIAASGNDPLDLQGIVGTTALTNLRGAVLFAKLKAILVLADPANNVANNVQVTRPASNGVPFLLAGGDGFNLGPGAFAILADPNLAGLATVTPGTGDLITMVNTAGVNSVDYWIVLIGT